VVHCKSRSIKVLVHEVVDLVLELVPDVMMLVPDVIMLDCHAIIFLCPSCSSAHPWVSSCPDLEGKSVSFGPHPLSYSQNSGRQKPLECPTWAVSWCECSWQDSEFFMPLYKALYLSNSPFKNQYAAAEMLCDSLKW
jgi:hypothetical protein